MKRENEEKRKMKKEYEVVTKEKLTEKIKKYNLRVNCYIHIWDMEPVLGYDRMSVFLNESPMPISGESIYYDTDFEEDSDIGTRNELDRMMNNIQENDVVILSKLEDLVSILYMDSLEFLMKLRNLKTELYTIDYGSENFIKININLLLIHLLKETGLFPPEFINEYYRMSTKYYDGKL